MNRTNILVAVALLLAVATSARAADWQEYKPDDGAFTVQFPRKPEVTKLDVPVTVKIDAKLVGVTTDDATFGVAIADYPPEVIAGIKIEDFFNNGRDSALAHNVGRLLSEKEIKIDGNPGRDYVTELPGGLVMHSRQVLVKNRGYQITVTSVKDRESASDVKRFTESFKLQVKQEDDCPCKHEFEGAQ